MRAIGPIHAFRSPRRRRLRDAFIRSSPLERMILGMLSLNSLAAFTAEVTRNAGIQPQRGATAPTSGAAFTGDPVQDIAAPQKALPAVPPRPQQSLPRGSLLDLRV